jgi:serine protease AprX
MAAAVFAAVLAVVSVVAIQSSARLGTAGSGTSSSSGSTSPLSELAASDPGKRVEVIVQMRAGADRAQADALAASAGGIVERPLPIINGFSTTLKAAKAEQLASNPAIHAVSLNAAVESQAIDTSRLATAYHQSIRSDKVWNASSGSAYTGKGIGVAVLDTGIAGTLPDFRTSETDATSRVVASAVINPGATRAGDTFGHGTHVAGLIAGNGNNRPAGDPLDGKYVGVAPEANLIDVKIADDQGNASLIDVIEGLQFAVDFKSDYNIRVANLSLSSTVAESYKTDPLDAAVEAAWNSGIVVVVAAGNSGATNDAVSYAPANDPFVVTVGGADDVGTANVADDKLASWSSRGKTQDGFAKPEIVAPGAHLISTMAPGAEYTRLCPTCVVDGSYFRVGGTSMAAGVASGEAALLIQAQPSLTPNEVKAQLIKRTRGVLKADSTSGTLIDANGQPIPSADENTTIEGGQVAADKAVSNGLANTSTTTPAFNSLIDPATGLIDYTRASWSRASWSTAVDGLRASWSRASWSRASWSSSYDK